MRLLSIITFISLLVSSCGVDVAQMKEKVATLEHKLQTEPSQDILDSLLTLYQDIANATQGDEHLEYVWKTGETARAAKQFDIATNSLQTLYTNHAETDYAPKSLFLHAFMADEDMENMDLARTLYQEFINKYPNSEFADDAEFLLANLGKSDEEMLEMLSKKQNVE